MDEKEILKSNIEKYELQEKLLLCGLKTNISKYKFETIKQCVDLISEARFNQNFYKSRLKEQEMINKLKTK